MCLRDRHIEQIIFCRCQLRKQQSARYIAKFLQCIDARAVVGIVECGNIFSQSFGKINTSEDLKRDGGSLLPKLHGALLKNEQDVHLFERLAFMARGQR